MLVDFYAFRSFHCMERSSLNTLSNISLSVLQKKGLELYGDEQMMMKYSSLDKPSHPNVRALLKPWPSGLCMCSKTCRIQTHSPLSPIFPVKVACVERNIGPWFIFQVQFEMLLQYFFEDVQQQYNRQNCASVLIFKQTY